MLNQRQPAVHHSGRVKDVRENLSASVRAITTVGAEGAQTWHGQLRVTKPKEVVCVPKAKSIIGP